MKRILAFLDPWAHRHDIGYQIAESLMSIGSGGLWGLGLGDGRQKLFFLPEAHTDFIFAIIGEELGLLGAGLVIALYAIVVWRGIRAAFNAADAFGAYLALGLTCLLGFGACVNLGVAMGVLPTKGLTLPFISYGGTSLIGSLFAAGVLLSVSQSRGGFLRAQARAASPRVERMRGPLPEGSVA
jgi:cell division protein FtsW